MSTAHIAIDETGTNHLSIDGRASAPVRGAGKAAQEAALAHVRDHAARIQQPVALQVQDHNGETFHLQVAPDGQVWTAPPAPQAPAPETAREDGPIPVPRVDQPAEPLVTEVPGAQAEPDLEATRERPVPSEDWIQPLPQQTPHVAAQHLEALAPNSQPASSAPAGDPVENDPRWAEIAQQPATQGFRGTLNGMGMKLSPTEDELNQRREDLRQDIDREEHERLAAEEHARMTAAQNSRRAAREREAAAKDKAQRAIIQTNYRDPKTVTVANRKGGVGKTTAIYCLAATAGRIRGGDVIAWDANETQGTLGYRAQKDNHSRSVVDLLEEAAEDFTTVQGSRRSTLMRYTRTQGDNQFGVVASDESSDRQDLVDGDAFSKVHEILARFHSLILIDTGNNHRVSHFKAALDATDQLVIPVSAGADGAHAAQAMIDNFIGLGYGDLVKNAVVLLNDSSTRRGNAAEIVSKFEDRVRAIIPIPFDPALDSGDEINFDALQPATRAAYQEATAAVAQGLADSEQTIR